MSSPTSLHSRKPSVFISYAHESAALSEAVQQLAECLERLHIAVTTDHPRLANPPREGWRSWLAGQIAEASVVLVVCSPKLKSRFERVGESTTSGAHEGSGITRAHFEEAYRQTKFFPIVCDDGDPADVPELLRAFDPEMRFPSQTSRIIRLTTEAMRIRGGQEVAIQAIAATARNTPTLDPSIRTLKPTPTSRVSWKAGLSVMATLVFFCLAMFQGSRETRAGRLIDNAEAALKRGDKGAARRPLETAMDLSVFDERAAHSLQAADAYDAFQSHHDMARLNRALAPVLHANPQHVHSRVAQAHALAFHGSSEAAEEIYREVLASTPDHLDAGLGIAMLHFRAGHHERTTRELSKLARFAPNDPRLFYVHGRLSSVQKQPKRAAKQYIQALRHDPSYLPPYLGLATAQRKQGQYDSALSTLLSAEADFRSGVERGINRGAWHFRSPEANADPVLTTPPAKLYFFRLSSAWTACMANDQAQITDALDQLAQIRASGALNADTDAQVRALAQDEFTHDPSPDNDASAACWARLQLD